MATTVSWWLGTVVGLVIGLIIKDAASELGKRLLRRATPGLTRRNAEEEKAGELEAIRKDLHNLIEQTREITALQSQIQADVNGAAWTRQTLWTERRNAYGNILRTFHDFQAAVQSSQAVMNPGAPTRGAGIIALAPTVEQLLETREGKRKLMDDTHGQLHDALSEAELFAGLVVQSAIQHLRSHLHVPQMPQDFDSLLEFLHNDKAKLVLAFRGELGIVYVD